MVAPFGALVYPAAENIYFGIAQGSFFVRHPLFRIVARQAPDQLAVGGVSRDDGPFPRLGGVERFMPEKQAVFGISFYAAMAANAMFVKDGLDLGAEIDAFFAS